MKNYNNIFLLGNLTRDPELRYTEEGKAFIDIGLAVNKKWTNSQGEQKSSVDYINITGWNQLAENCAASLKKGDRVMIGGKINLKQKEKDGKNYNIMYLNAEVVAASLEFSEVSFIS